MYKSLLYSSAFSITGGIIGNQLYDYHLKSKTFKIIGNCNFPLWRGKNGIQFIDIPYYLINSLIFTIGGGLIGYYLSRIEINLSNFIPLKLKN